MELILGALAGLVAVSIIFVVVLWAVYRECEND